MKTQTMMLQKPYECPICFTKYCKEIGYVKHSCRKSVMAMKKLIGG